MKKKKIKKRFLLLFLSLFSVFIFLNALNLNLGYSKKVKIVTSIFPLMEFARAVSGDRGEVSLLLPAGAEVHTWQARPSDIIRLSSADLFIYIGSDLEPWIQDILKSVKSSNLNVLEASQGISLIEGETQNREHEHGVADPHIWLDFRNDQIIVDRIADVLSGIDPGGIEIYRKNAASYKEKLKRLDQKFMDSLKNCTHRTFIMGSHSAFGYLARRYNLRQISLFGLSPDSRPTPKKLIEVAELARRYKIEVIFFEASVSGKLAKVLAEEVGARTLVINPGASLTKEQLKSGTTFFDIMEKNLENFKDALICR
jgi:zinc transport system substrate-binding protein